jgi:CRP/FNR family cyclic AMP-dependent transcriptional regulator
MATSDQPQRMGAKWADVLEDVPLFAGLSKRHLRKVAGLGYERRVPAHTAVVRAGGRGDAFFVILDGSASVRRPGKRTVVLRPGDFFGELALLDGSPRTATVEADTDMLLMWIARSEFGKLLKSEPLVAVQMLQTLAQRLRAVEA